MRSPTIEADGDEKELLESVERGQWKSHGGGKRERARYSRYAKATFRKDLRLNIRLSSQDLEAIQKRALAEGLPYQTLISSRCASTRPAGSRRCDLRRLVLACAGTGHVLLLASRWEDDYSAFSHQWIDTVGAPGGT